MSGDGVLVPAGPATGRSPALVTCHGGRQSSELLEAVTRELGRLGVGEPAARADAAGPGTDVIVLDACPSACGSRLAAARGANVVAALNLADLGDEDALAATDVGELALRAADAIRSGAGTSRSARPHRPERSTPRPGGGPHTVEDYLLAIDALSSPVVECGIVISDAPTLASHVSDALGVSRPTAGEMLAKLEAGGLVRRDERKTLLLTDPGRAAVDRALQRQRLLEVFAVDVLGYALADAWEQARLLRDAFDDDAAGRLAVALGAPTRCPHGWPLDAALARAERSGLRTLDAIDVGEIVTVMGLAEGDAGVLHRLAALGVAPGVRLRVCGEAHHAGREVEVGGSVVAVDERAGRAIFVTPAAGA
jgi:DtxR family transcriptional regulator, Mn-dependent transcriptional regulator